MRMARAYKRTACHELKRIAITIPAQTHSWKNLTVDKEKTKRYDDWNWHAHSTRTSSAGLKSKKNSAMTEIDQNPAQWPVVIACIPLFRPRPYGSEHAIFSAHAPSWEQLRRWPLSERWSARWWMCCKRLWKIIRSMTWSEEFSLSQMFRTPCRQEMEGFGDLIKHTV